MDNQGVLGIFSYVDLTVKAVKKLKDVSNVVDPTQPAFASFVSSDGSTSYATVAYGEQIADLPKDTFEDLKSRVSPDLVLTHTRDDLHQDHRLVCELTWNTFRDHLILEYEIPKWDGDVGRPNVYVPLEEPVVQEKLDLLGGHFDTQRGKDWYDVEVFRGLMRIRGMECRAESGYAEAFTARKMTLEMSGGKGST